MLKAIRRNGGTVVEVENDTLLFAEALLRQIEYNAW